MVTKKSTSGKFDVIHNKYSFVIVVNNKVLVLLSDFFLDGGH